MMLPGFPEAQPLEGLLGGVLIGLAAAIMLLGLGRIAGVSGMFARATAIEGGSPPWPIAALFIVGLILGAVAFQAAIGPIEARFPPGLGLLIAGGTLVGFGTRLGSGCTSGHGVCGMSRLSPRSLVATATFIAAGVATVAIVNALEGAW
ncbi:YeeE/YedE thiosulfate transporter family protein [Qipengyuania sp. G39]|uniref:YeeE/YedE thiosulfate transporter family protein n=1 Tax=Qipengyuania profundimaris TaxID=3067652 RepID=A0ABT9HNU3_9SPHN|nr:YeeE/YedE thiosulfate transporter family protein [Qipengyuania sp. G39]MDP4574813.1 YeeE/YedE thiosulfate transporter family protein [Qipengyuania sp. G39]